MADFPGYLLDHGPFIYGPVSDDHLGTVIPPSNVDRLPPTVTLLSPAVESVVQPEDLITLRMDDENEIANCFVWVEYADGSSEIVYRDNQFRPTFLARSSAVFADETHRRLTLVIGRGDGVTFGQGWPFSPDLYAAPIDRGGNIS